MKNKILVFVLFLFSLFFAFGQNSPIDLILLLDTSSDMASSYETVNNYITGNFLTEFLRTGDTFHLIVYSSRPRLDAARRINGVGDLETIIGRMLLQYPLERGNDPRGAIAFTENYVSSLPARQKKIVMVGRPSSDIQSLVSSARQRLSSFNTTIDFVPVNNGQPLTNLPSSGRAAIQRPQETQAQPAQETQRQPAPQQQTQQVTPAPQQTQREQTAPQTQQTQTQSQQPQVQQQTQTAPVQETQRQPAQQTQPVQETQRQPAQQQQTQPAQETQRQPTPVPPVTETPIEQIPEQITHTEETIETQEIISDEVPEENIEELIEEILNEEFEIAETQITEEPIITQTPVPASSPSPQRREQTTRQTPLLPSEALPLILAFILFSFLLFLLIFFILRRRNSSSSRSYRPVSASNYASQPKQRETPYSNRVQKNANEKSVIIDPREPVLLNLFVEDQNTAIGKRNIHSLKSGYRLTVGGGKKDDFLIFLVPLPSHIGEIYREGSICTFIPKKPKYFPDLGSSELRDCINKTIRVISDKNYELKIKFILYEDPLLQLNRMLMSVKVSG